MERRFISFKCGNTFKYISIPLNDKRRSNDVDVDCYLHLHNITSSQIIEKSFNNVIRAKSTIKDLILCNDFKYFITLTCNNDYSKLSTTELQKVINNKLRKLRNKNHKNYHFILVAEKHKSGVTHFHGVINGDFDDFITYNMYDHLHLSIFDFLGFSNAQKIVDKDRVSSYICKYITKDFEDREKNKHLYCCSHGLIRPIKLEDFVYDNEYFNKNYFDVKNDFCLCKYSKDKKFFGDILTN